MGVGVGVRVGCGCGVWVSASSLVWITRLTATLIELAHLVNRFATTLTNNQSNSCPHLPTGIRPM